MTENDTKIGEKAMEEINKFINKSWQNYRSKHFPDTIELKGLAGLTIGNKKSGVKKPTDTVKNKPITEPKPPRPKPEFEKLGIWKKGLSSVKENGIWKYSLVLKTNDDKQLNIKMFPATDAARVSNDDLLEVIQVSDGWNINKNTIEGSLSKGENTIEFNLNTSERVALDFKLNSL
jgi:signal peptidase I